jgi:hypothetical protein
LPSLYPVERTSLEKKGWSLAANQAQNILDKLKACGIPLGEYVAGSINYGIKTGFNEAFVIDASTRKKLIDKDPKSAEIIKPFVVGDDIRYYDVRFKNKYLIFTRRGINIENYPAVLAHLSTYKTRLLPKPSDWKGENWQGRKAGTYQWYEIQDSVDYFEEFEKPKIIYPVIAKESRFSLDIQGYYANDKTFIIAKNDLYLLGILNSKLMWFLLKYICSPIGDPEEGGRLELRGIYMKTLPIRRLNLDIPEEANSHRKLCMLVELMLKLKKDYAQAEANRDDLRHELLERIQTTDKAIDRDVYALYGLTEEEIAIVEG